MKEKWRYLAKDFANKKNKIIRKHVTYNSVLATEYIENRIIADKNM